MVTLQIVLLYYTVGHKKRATLFWTITSAFLDGFQHFVYQGRNILHYNLLILWFLVGYDVIIASHRTSWMFRQRLLTVSNELEQQIIDNAVDQ